MLRLKNRARARSVMTRQPRQIQRRVDRRNQVSHPVMRGVRVRRHLPTRGVPGAAVDLVAVTHPQVQTRNHRGS